MGKFMVAAVLAAVFVVAPPVTRSVIAATDPPATEQKKELTPGQIAFRERQKKCAAEWKEAKALGKTEGLTWPKFWSKCNKRLKAQTQ